MSDNIPFEIQMEIIKKVSNVKSLIQFRSVSKQWKSFIDSPDFIKGYGARHTQPHSRILNYKVGYSSDPKFFCLVDDDNETFKVQQQEFAPFVMSPLLKQFSLYEVVGTCHGLMCLYGFHKGYKNRMVVIWNPSIGKSFGIVVPSFFSLEFRFGVCPITRDPTVVNILCTDKMKPWHVEVFTLSSGVWNVIPCSKLPRQSIKLNTSTQVVIDRFIYWGAHENTFTEHGRYKKNHMVVSFDLVTKEFKVVNLPDILTNEIYSPMSVSVCKLSGSLVVSAYILAEGALCCGVWVMEHDSSFRKLFNIGASFDKIFGFRKNGEPIFEIQHANEQFTTLNVYDPCSQQIKNLSIYGVDGSYGSFVMGTYKESLLLLDHLDSQKSGESLSFRMRLTVALDSAKGILYLHTEANPPILHRDIKTSNVLIDSKLTAKVADFGLSRLAPLLADYGVGPNYVHTVVRGTPGYLDPEYLLTHKLTHKSGIYSLGVVLFEILTSMKPIHVEEISSVSCKV
ncbi:probable LRR receptor-like serine/threonine-protein kinase isoform X2 [Tanacetum coccineum]|uniref:Probable LRR receptor-like serine/threonine-protein kinase isoform X2 n=1 Tax=Tanacetum coccineum TaxID=301880 RepID=A0ABQ5FYY7_9ASTR